jgi:hypothetical protein
MSIDSVLGRNAMTLAALRELLVAYDKGNNTHRPVGWDVFRWVVHNALQGTASVAEVIEVTDIHKWVEEIEAMAMPPKLNHVTVQAQVNFATGAEDEDSVQPGEDIGSCYDDAPESLSAVMSEGTLQMLRPGADPSDEDAWMPVGSISSFAEAIAAEPPAQSITGEVGIPSDNGNTVPQCKKEEQSRG